MDIEVHSRPKKKPSTRNKTSRVVRESLQLSSYWLRVPTLEGTEEDFFAVPKPRGERVLIVTANQKTQVLGQDGSLKEHQSLLPGGGKGSYAKLGCMLDAIQTQEDRFFVVDALYFDGNSYLETPAELRHYFLENHIDASLAAKSGSNHIKISLLPHVAPRPETLRQLLAQTADFEPDGLLLVDKQSDYLMGEVNPHSYWIRSRPSDGVLGRLILAFNLEKMLLESADCVFALEVPPALVEFVPASPISPPMAYWAEPGRQDKVRLLAGKSYVVAVLQLAPTAGLFFDRVKQFAVQLNTYKAPYDSARVKKKLAVMREQLFVEDLI